MAPRALGFIAALVCALPAVAAPAARSKAFPFPAEVVQLSNGLRVVLVKFDSPGLAAYYTLVRVGSRNEPEPGKSGFAHFFEHMMFRGTKTHPAEDFAATVQRLGLDSNASTSEDETIYRMYGPAKALPTIIEYEADRFAHLEYTEEQFRSEAGAILGEYAKSSSSPDLKLEEAIAETAFQKHTYRHTTIGYLDDIKAMPEGFAYSRQFFERYYRPDNAVVVIAGDFDRAKTLALVKKAYAPWKGRAKPAAVPKEPPQTEARRAAVDWPQPTLARLTLQWHQGAASDLKSTAAAVVLGRYLAGPTSPLYTDLVLERQLVDALSAGGAPSRDPGLFSFYARIKDPAQSGEVEKTLLAAVAELRAGKVDAALLDAVRSNLKYSNILRLDTAQAAAAALAQSIGPTGDPQFLNKLYAQIDALKPQELAAFAKKFLTEKNLVVVTLAHGAPAGQPGGAN